MRQLLCGTRELLRFSVLAWLLLLCGSPIASEWRFIEDHDPMEDIDQYGARSSMVGAEENLPFPYNDIQAALVIACNSERNQWAYLAFSSDPNPADREIATDSYSNVPIAVRWDTEREDYRLSQDHGSQYLAFKRRDIDEVIDYSKTANTMLFQINIYSAGETLFRIPLSGSDAVITQAQSKCGVSSSKSCSCNRFSV
jgi:hypothetical protein